MPEKQITYTQKFTVYRADGDHLGNVKLGALLRYAQQIATTHAEAAGLIHYCNTALDKARLQVEEIDASLAPDVEVPHDA